MTQEELDKIIERHQHWIKKDCEGWEDMKADLRNANLSDANLRNANLSGADLSGADLSDANLYGADLSDANLSDAGLYRADLIRANLSDANLSSSDLYRANLIRANLIRANLSDANLSSSDLRWADLRWANLYNANLSSSDLSGADLSGANLTDANLNWADLCDANLSDTEKFRLGKVLDEPMTGYKKTKEGVVITAEIPAGAIVFSINGSKCRTNKAKITDMAGHDVLHSSYDDDFEYRLGQEINIKDFNLMYNTECASGFHFFRTLKEAEEYK